jgi:flagellar basal-body rod protein FlgB
MDRIISAVIAKALDGLYLRSQATAQNIANVNSPGFRPLSVSFEAALEAAAGKDERAVAAVPLEIREADPLAGGGVRMDLELETQSETAMRFGALVDVLARELQLDRSVIRGGQ